MRPVGITVLHQAGDTGGAWLDRRLAVLAARDNRMVRLEDTEREEHRRALHDRMTQRLECVQQRLYQDLRRHLAAAVSAEAVGHGQEHGVVAFGIAHPVFVGAPRAAQAELRDLVFHGVISVRARTSGSGDRETIPAAAPAPPPVPC